MSLPRLSLLLVLAACGSPYVKLDAKKVRGVTVKLREGGTTYCANGPLWPEVIAVISYEGHKVLETETPNHAGKVRSSDVDWSTDAGRVHKGLWLLPHDLFVWYDRRLQVRVSIPTRPELSSELTLSPRFDCAGVADYSGLAGEGAETWGGAGEPGRQGPRVEVALAYVDTEMHGRLVLVRVIDHDYGRRDYHLVDPRTAERLHLSADGGAGGAGSRGIHGDDGARGKSGEHGAHGGNCQDGGDGTPGLPGGDGTPGQPGGHGGGGGDGGTVVVTYPANFPELARAVDVTVNGGPGGDGGAGGKGGTGGEGGEGGHGGFAGAKSDGSRECATRNGVDGPRGPSGQPGAGGDPGAVGAQGNPGAISTATDTVEHLFSFELGRGWKIVR